MTHTRETDLALIKREELQIARAIASIVQFEPVDEADAEGFRNRERLCALARLGLDAVPREPDSEMTRAGVMANYSFDKPDVMPIESRANAVWRAMFDAATRGGT